MDKKQLTITLSIVAGVLVLVLAIALIARGCSKKENLVPTDSTTTTTTADATTTTTESETEPTVDLENKIVFVLQKELRPHRGVEPCDSCHVLV